MNGQLILGTAMIVVAVIFHVAGLVYLASLLQRVDAALHRLRPRFRLIMLLALATLVIIAIHTIEAWAWALLFYRLGEFTDLSNALYFSVVTSTTLGYGDVTLSETWRLLGTFEAMGGLILFGASTAFLLGTMRQLFYDATHSADAARRTPFP